MMASIQPKFIMRKTPMTYDLFAIICALKYNHGSIILKYILIEMGFSMEMMPNSLISLWIQLDNAKTRRRVRITTSQFKDRRKKLKSQRKCIDKCVKANNNKISGSYEHL